MTKERERQSVQLQANKYFNFIVSHIQGKYLMTEEYKKKKGWRSKIKF